MFTMNFTTNLYPTRRKTPKHYLKKLAFDSVLFALVIIAAACKDDTGSLGLGFHSELLGTDFTDTITVDAYSVLEDTINTTNMSANLVGSLHDPIFGNSTAAIYAQFGLAGSGVNFGENPVLDSVVLTLQIAGYYGDTTSQVAIRAYQLTEALSQDVKYYQNSTVANDNTPLNYSLTGHTIAPNTQSIIDTSTYNPHLRVRLSQAFGQYLLNHQAQMGNTADFQNFFKGLCIDAVSHTGNTGYLLITGMTGSLTGITLYYHNNTDNAVRYTFPCLNTCVRFNRFTHDYNASGDIDFIHEVLNDQTSVGAEKLFVQATGGVKTKITFPYLQEAFKALDNKVVINRAELVITNVAPDEEYFTAPTALTLQGIRTETGTVAFIPDDETYTGQEHYGGTYNKNTHEYRFRITRYVQEQILQSGNLTNSLYLVVKGSSVRANRLVFGGTGLQDDLRLRLELSYTTY